MNRGSGVREMIRGVHRLASMRPRFMNRGSVADVLRERGIEVMLQ